MHWPEFFSGTKAKGLKLESTLDSLEKLMKTKTAKFSALSF